MADTGALVDDVKKIAVLRANALGDYIFALPALSALRAAYPDAEIVLLGAPWHERFLTGRPGPVDRVLTVPPVPGVRAPGAGESAGDAWREVERLRDERFDIAIQMHGGGRYSNPLVSALGARVTAGLRAPDAPAPQRWVRYEYYQPEVFRYLEVVGLVGAAPVTYTPRLALTDADYEEARRALPVGAGAASPSDQDGPPRLTSRLGERRSPRVVLHPGATDARRRWPADRFAAVGDALAGLGAQIVVTGTPPERDLVDQVVTAMDTPAIPLVGAVSIGGLAALLAESALVIANDTGPVHVAEAVGCATVGLYWVGNLINGAPPYRHRHRPMLSWTIHCPVCGADCTRDLYPHRGGDQGCGHQPSFVADIPVAEVVDAAADLLGNPASGVDAGREHWHS